MAIVQISQITQRQGLNENLPQLAGGEFGWSNDTRQLYIGNGTLAQGAPVIGNTEILTEFSDIIQFNTNYTYQGLAAGYTAQTGPTPGTPVTQSLQSWLDQFATVKDFGAVGDGVTDDTAAINRALYQIYCREVNPQIRRSLFFPAGIYRVTAPINIPTYATLYGEGLNNSLIVLDDGTASNCVAQTADSLQQTGVNIGNLGATPPQFITVANIGFVSLDPNVDVFLVEDAVNCRFENVNFIGPLTTADLTTATNGTRGVAFASTPSLVCNQLVFTGCNFSGTTWAMNTDDQTKGITVQNSKFDVLYRGIELGTGAVINGGPTGFRISQNIFDNICAEGVIFGDISLNATGYNIFYDVGDNFLGVTNPYTACIDIQTSNNLSVGDMFERADAYSNAFNPGTAYPRITINETESIAFTNGAQMQLGSYTKTSGVFATLVDNTVTFTTIISFDTAFATAFKVDFNIVRDTEYSTGTLTVVSGAGANPINWTVDVLENAPTGVTFDVVQVGTTINVQYTTTSTGANATLDYSINYLA